MLYVPSPYLLGVRPAIFEHLANPSTGTINEFARPCDVVVVITAEVSRKPYGPPCTRGEITVAVVHTIPDAL